MEPGTPIVVTKIIRAYNLQPGARGFYVRANKMEMIKTLHLVQIDGEKYSLIDGEFDECK